MFGAAGEPELSGDRRANAASYQQKRNSAVDYDIVAVLYSAFLLRLSRRPVRAQLGERPGSQNIL